MTTGCLNPLFFEDVEPAVNHAPAVTNLLPQPSFEDVVANAGANCAPPEAFRADRLDDADGDVLTVRWTLLVPRADGAARIPLLEEELEPLEPPIDDVEYDFRPFELSGSRLRIALGGDLDNQSKADVQQLLELRISDRGFKPGTDEPRADAGSFLASWGVKLLNTECVF